jgi:hypothetical protein
MAAVAKTAAVFDTYSRHSQRGGGAPRRGLSVVSVSGAGNGLMRFTVTFRVGVTEVVDRPESARAALERVLVLLGRKRNDVRIFDEDGSHRTAAELCRLAAQEVAMLPDD